MVLLVLLTAAWAGLYALLHHGWGGTERRQTMIFAAPLYVGLYVSLGVVVGKLTPMRRLGEPLATRLSFFGMVSLAAIVFPVLAVLTGKRANDREWNLLNPIFGMVNFADRLSGRTARVGLMLLVTGWVLTSAIAWIVLKKRDVERIG